MGSGGSAFARRIMVADLWRPFRLFLVTINCAYVRYLSLGERSSLSEGEGLLVRHIRCRFFLRLKAAPGFERPTSPVRAQRVTCQQPGPFTTRHLILPSRVERLSSIVWEVHTPKQLGGCSTIWSTWAPNLLNDHRSRE